MTRLTEFALAQGSLMLATAIWSLVGAALLWFAVAIVNRFLTNAILRPSYWKAYAVVFVPGVVLQLMIAILLAVDVRLAGVTNYLVLPAVFFLMSGLLIVLLPTTALRACLVTGIYLLMTLGAGTLFALVAESVRFLA